MMKRIIYRCCVMAVMVAVCSDPARSDDPPQASTAGMRVFHDRIVAFVDAQLAVLRESGKWQGEDVSIVFMGINNRWDKAWELTQKNFEEGKRVVVVPTHNLPYEKMDLPGAALDHFRTAFPRTPITTRKIGVPELLRHLDEQGVRVSGLSFSSGANFVLQENVSLLVRYAQQQAMANGHFPTTSVVNSGGISEFAHADRLREVGCDVRQTGERALVTAVEQRFADFDPTGLRIPALGVLGYIGNAVSHMSEPFGPEGKHGYDAFRKEVNQALVEAADYNTLVKGLTGSENPLSDALADMKRGLDRQVALDRSVERSLVVSATLDRIQELRRQGAVGKGANPVAQVFGPSTASERREELITKTLDAMEHDRSQQNRTEIVRTVLDRIEAERNRLATPEDKHPMVVLPRHRGQILKPLGAEKENLRLVLETDNLVRRQVGLTRWSIVEYKDSQEAFLTYDATGQNYGEAVKTVNAMLGKLGESGVILVGDPDSIEYVRLKEAFEAAGVPIKGEVKTKGKSKKEILEETAELQKRFGGIAVEVRDEARDEDEKDESGASDEPDRLEYDSSDLDIDIEEVDGLWKITFKINGIPIWEVVIDEDGNIVCQGPPGACDGGPRTDQTNKSDRPVQADKQNERPVDYEVEKLNGNTKITVKIKAIPVWEVVIDENGGVVGQGAPRRNDVAPALVGPLDPVPDPIGKSRPHHEPSDAHPILFLASPGPTSCPFGKRA